MPTDSLRVTDDLSKAVQKTPNRVSLDSILASIKSEQIVHPDAAPHMTILVMELASGFIVIGKAAPADPENFDPELGVKFAREDAIRQVWPLAGYTLREKLAATQAFFAGKD